MPKNIQDVVDELENAAKDIAFGGNIQEVAQAAKRFKEAKESLTQLVKEVEAGERERFAKTVRRKMFEWSSQYHLQHFDRTLSHQSGMAVGYSAAAKAVDNLITGIEKGTPLDDTPPISDEEKDEQKPSKIFEGENSSLRKTFDEAIKDEHSDTPKLSNHLIRHDFLCPHCDSPVVDRNPDEHSDVKGNILDYKGEYWIRCTAHEEVVRRVTDKLQHLQEQHEREKRELVEEMLIEGYCTCSNFNTRFGKHRDYCAKRFNEQVKTIAKKHNINL